MLARTSPVLKLLNEQIENITRTPEEERLFDSRMKMKSPANDKTFSIQHSLFRVYYHKSFKS